MRAWAIERLMCDFELSFAALRQKFGQLANELIGEARLRAIQDVDGFVALENDRFVIKERGKPFARTIASWFDAYLGNGVGRHSIAV